MGAEGLEILIEGIMILLIFLIRYYPQISLNYMKKLLFVKLLNNSPFHINT